MSNHLETMRKAHIKLVEAQDLFTQAQTEAFSVKDAKAVTSTTRALGYTNQAVKSSQTILTRVETETETRKV